jgi:hypothetical protein
MESGNQKHRYTYSRGVKAVEESKWGAAKAVERYGSLPNPDMRPVDKHGPEAPIYKHGPRYENSTPDDWRRGAGKSRRRS